MKIEQMKKLLDKKHISDFTLEELFTKLGIYEECIIDVQAIEEIKAKMFVEYFVSKDVKRLFEVTSNNSVVSVCPLKGALIISLFVK